MSAKKETSAASGNKMTERQMAEKAEAKKLKIYTGIFAAAMVLIVVLAIVGGVNNWISTSGAKETGTIAATVGEHKISDAEMSYYFIDNVNNFKNTYGSYAYLYGIDTSTPLDQQTIDAETGKTWADYFMESAMSNAQSVYAMCDAAKEAGYSLSAEEQQSVDSYVESISTYAKLYNYSSGDALLKAQYGNGASTETYAAYYGRNILASSYQTYYQNSIENTAEEISAKDSASPEKYTSYSYNQYYLLVSRFLSGGTAADDGTVTYSDEERAAAAQKAAEAAESLTACKNVEELDAAIAGLEINADTSASSTAYTNQAYSSVNSTLADWVTDASRNAGDCTAVEVKSSDDVTAYYIVLFNGANKNEAELINVRHILIGFSGEQDENGNYTEAAREANLAQAQDILDQWKNGDANAESFAALASQYSTDSGSSANGGLYENVYPGMMVSQFNDWCFDSSREEGDTGIVETTYGYHIMYFAGKTGETYRNYQISNELTNEKMNTWFSSVIEKAPLTAGDTSYINTSVSIG